MGSRLCRQACVGAPSYSQLDKTTQGAVPQRAVCTTVLPEYDGPQHQDREGKEGREGRGGVFTFTGAVTTWGHGHSSCLRQNATAERAGTRTQLAQTRLCWDIMSRAPPLYSHFTGSRADALILGCRYTAISTCCHTPHPTRTPSTGAGRTRLRRGKGTQDILLLCVSH